MGIERFVRPPFGGVAIHGVTLEGEDLSGGTAGMWQMHASRFTNCDFSRSRGEFCFGTGTVMSEYIDCRFDGSTISAAVAGRARFVRCSFEDVAITKWISTEAEIVDCTFSGTIHDFVFHARVRDQSRDSLGRATNRFERNNLSRAQLKAVAFSGGVDLLGQILPPAKDGYVLVEHADTVLPAVLEEVSQWPVSDVRKAIMSAVQLQLRWYLTDGQQQVLFSPLDWVSRDGHKERAYAELRSLLAKHASVSRAS